MSNTSYSLPASNFSCLHMCELSVFCSGVFLEVRTKNSEHALFVFHRASGQIGEHERLAAGWRYEQKEGELCGVCAVAWDVPGCWS